jgi:TolB-like protein
MHSALIACLLAATQAPPESAAHPKLAVFELTVAGGIDPAVGGPMTEAITTEVASRGFFDVISSRDMETMLGAERKRQLLGCSEEGSCLTELAGGLGARFVLSGSLAKLGDTYQLTLQTLDSRKAQPVGRSTRLAKDLATLRGQLPWAVAEATATPAPPPPSHLLAYSLIGAGAAAIVGGAALGLSANSEAAGIQNDFAQSDANPSYKLLKTASQYQSDVTRLQIESAGAIAAVVAGAAAIGLGLYLNPSDGGGTRIAIVASPTGVAFAGAW